MKKILVSMLLILCFFNAALAAQPKVNASQMKVGPGLINTDGSLKTYSSVEIDNKLSDKADTSAVAVKANTADVYTKAEVDAKVNEGSGTSSSQTMEITVDENINAGDVVFFTDYTSEIKARKTTTVSGTPQINNNTLIDNSLSSFSTCNLTDNIAIVAYATDGLNTKVSCLKKVDGVPTIVGTAIIASDYASFATSITRVSSNSAVLVYMQNSDTYLKAAKITYNEDTLEVSKDSIIYGAATAAFKKFSVANINSNQSIVFFRHSDSYARAMLIEEGESSFTNQTPIAATSPSNTLNYCSDIVKYDDSGAVAVFNSNNGIIVASFTISGSTLSRSAEYVLDNTNTAYPVDIEKFSVDKFVVSVGNSSGNQAKIHLLSIPSLSSISSLDSDNSLQFSESIIRSVSENSGYISYLNATTHVINIIPLNVSGDNIVLGATLNSTYAVEYPSNTPYSNFSMTNINFTDSFVCYRSSDQKGKVFIYNSGITLLRRPKVSGIAQITANAGNTTSVLLSGSSNVHSGLIPKQTYYLQSSVDLSIGTTPVSISNINKNYPALTGEVKVGTAKSSTELIVDIDYE